jgi:hypothetical protein
VTCLSYWHRAIWCDCGGTVIAYLDTQLPGNMGMHVVRSVRCGTFSMCPASDQSGLHGTRTANAVSMHAVYSTELLQHYLVQVTLQASITEFNAMLCLRANVNVVNKLPAQVVSNGHWGRQASGIVHCFNFPVADPVLPGTTDTESQSHGPNTPSRRSSYKLPPSLSKAARALSCAHSAGSNITYYADRISRIEYKYVRAVKRGAPDSRLQPGTLLAVDIRGFR